MYVSSMRYGVVSKILRYLSAVTIQNADFIPSHYFGMGTL